MDDVRIVLIDDEGEVRDAYRQTLELDGFSVSDAPGAAGGLAALVPGFAGAVLSDVRMPEMDGFALLEAVRRVDPGIPVILVTGHGDVPMAIRAMRQGAYDFIEKPADPDHLIDVVRRACAHRMLELENRRLRDRLRDVSTGAGRMIGRSPAIERVRTILASIADTSADVLIEGETGTGKEVAARYLHDMGPRRAGNFVAINCGALPETILESELFGHEKGAYTGATSQRVGKFEHAHGGTLFLDEIESMPMPAQIRLLRVLQERVVEPLGANREKPVDIRVVAATKADLKSLSDEGRFRPDLYYRLHVVRVALPPLRARREDIALLLNHFLEAAAARHARPAPTLDPALAARLLSHDWPGNVRELRNVAERMVLGLEEGFSPAAPDPAPEGGEGSLADRLDSFEKAEIEAALAQAHGRVTLAADRLGVTRKTLYLKMRKYGLEKRLYRD